MDRGKLGVCETLNSKARRYLHEVLQSEGVKEAEEQRGKEKSHENEVIEVVILLPLLSYV